MEQGLKVIRSAETTLNSWSGGTTRELYIYPATSSYTARDFLFRLSIATVEVEKSDFTPLPGVRRVTMILEGEIVLHHEGNYSKTLRPFESDAYDGAWQSRSEGRCTDFNLMMRETAEGEVEMFRLKEGEVVSFINADSTHALYVHTGTIERNETVLEAGDLVVWTEEEGEASFLSIGESTVVYCEISRA